MKSSNVLLGLWFLVIMALAFGAVWFFLRRETPGAGYGKPETPPVDLPRDPKPPVQTTRTPRTPTKREPPPPPAPALITGSVVDVEGKPVAGARVRALAPNKPAPPVAAPDLDEIRRVNSIVDVPVEEWDAPRPLVAWTEIAPPGEDAAAPASVDLTAADTGADGRFILSLAPSYGRGPFRVIARKEGAGSAGASGVQAGQELELVLAASGVVTGQVVSDARPGPVVGARLVFDSGERQFSGETDDSGNFRIEGMSPGSYTLRAGAKGLTPLLDHRVTVVRDQPLVVKLPRGVTVKVKAIVDDEESPVGGEPTVRGAEIVVIDEDTFAYVIGRTDDYGMVEFAGLPSGRWIVNGRAEGLVSIGEETVLIKDDQEAHPVEISFEKAVPTPLTVVDEEGQPVVGMEFYSANPDEEYDVLLSDKLPGATDPQGRYEFAFEFSGRRAMVFGFKKGFGVVRAFPDDYAAGEPMRLVARKAIRVHGRVANGEGSAVADATVVFSVEPPSAGDAFDDTLMLRIRSGPDGKYDFPFLPAGSEITIEAETEDGWSDDSPVIEAEDTKTEHRIDLTIDDAPDPRVTPGGQPKPMPMTPPKAPPPPK